LIGLVNSDRTQENEKRCTQKKNYGSSPVSVVVKVYTGPLEWQFHSLPQLSPSDVHAGRDYQKTEDKKGGQNDIKENPYVGAFYSDYKIDSKQKQNNEGRSSR
jgi:hypothetical protein